MALKAKASSDTTTGIRAIAEALGVSIATVDRALHNRGRISQNTRASVLRMADQLEYKPNLAARDLRLNRRFRVSINLPIGVTSFFDALRSGIEEGALPFRSALEIEFHTYVRTQNHELRSIHAALAARVNGVIVAASNTPQMTELVRKAKQKAIPVIFVATDAPESGRLTAVTAHPFTCGAMAAEVLGTCIDKRGPIAVLTGDFENLNHSEKMSGFRTMISQILPELSVAVIEGHDDPKQAYRQMRKLLQSTQKLSGLYVSTANSIPALTALREMGRLESVSVVTTDLFPELVPFIRDGVVRATVFQCPETQGSIAIRTLYEYLSEKITPLSSIGVVPQLIMRSNLDLFVRSGAGLRGQF